MGNTNKLKEMILNPNYPFKTLPSRHQSGYTSNLVVREPYTSIGNKIYTSKDFIMNKYTNNDH